MKIIKVESIPISIPFEKPFRIALGEISTSKHVVVKISTDEGILGLGAATPFPVITGETQASTHNTLEAFLGPAIIGEDPFNIQRIVENMDKVVKGNKSAKAAIDFAIYDILGKKLQVPVCALIGGHYREEVLISRALSIQEPAEMAKNALRLMEKGFKVIKAKIGVDPRKDIERVKAVKDVLGNGATLRVDANQGYTTKQALWVIKKIERYEPEFVEQPVPAHNIDGLAQVAKAVDVPIMADESVFTPSDAIRIVERRAADIINIKLLKSGGIYNALKIAAIAEAGDIACMVGGMVETNAGLSAGAHFSTAVKNSSYAAEIGGSMERSKGLVDPFRGIEIRNGVVKIPDKHGLGIEIDDECLESLKSINPLPRSPRSYAT